MTLHKIFSHTLKQIFNQQTVHWIKSFSIVATVIFNHLFESMTCQVRKPGRFPIFEHMILVSSSHSIPLWQKLQAYDLDCTERHLFVIHAVIRRSLNNTMSKSWFNHWRVAEWMVVVIAKDDRHALLCTTSILFWSTPNSSNSKNCQNQCEGGFNHPG